MDNQYLTSYGYTADLDSDSPPNAFAYTIGVTGVTEPVYLVQYSAANTATLIIAVVGDAALNGLLISAEYTLAGIAGYVLLTQNPPNLVVVNAYYIKEQSSNKIVGGFLSPKPYSGTIGCSGGSAVYIYVPQDIGTVYLPSSRAPTGYCSFFGQSKILRAYS